MPTDGTRSVVRIGRPRDAGQLFIRDGQGVVLVSANFTEAKERRDRIIARTGKKDVFVVPLSDELKRELLGD